MRRGFVVLIGFYVILFGAFLITNHPENEFINMITIQEEISQVLYEDESLNLILFIDDTDRFVSNVELIESVLLRGNFNFATVEITAFHISDYSLEWNQTQYYKVEIEIRFVEVALNECDLVLENAFLDILFTNQQTLSLPYGNITLKFSNHQEPQHLEMIKMSGIPKPSSEELFGIVITLESNTVSEININHLDMMTQSLEFKLEELRVLSENDINIVANDMESVTIETIDLTEQPILNSHELILFVPIAYTDDSLSCSRFPVIINYEYLGNQYEYIIDDFLFFQRQVNFEEEDHIEFSVTHYFVGKR